MRNKTQIPVVSMIFLIAPIIIFLLAPSYSSAAQVDFEKAGLGRIVGDSPQEIVDQLNSADINLKHATFYSDEYLPHKISLPTDDPKIDTSENLPDNRLSNIDKLLKAHFPDNYNLTQVVWDWNDVEKSFGKFLSNEFFVIETSGKADGNQIKAGLPNSFSGNLKPSETYGWVSQFGKSRPLFLFDSDYAGLYLPKSVDSSNSFVGQLSQDSVMMAPTAISDKELVRSYACYLIMNSALRKNNSAGEIFRDARNAYYWQGNSPFGLALMSYEMYGNPLLKTYIPSDGNYTIIANNCKPYVQLQEGGIIKSSSLFPSSVFPFSSGDKYVLENSIRIANHTIDNSSGYALLQIGGMTMQKIQNDIMLPQQIEMREFPLKTIILDLSSISLGDPVDIQANIPMWNGSSPVARECRYDEKEAGVFYEHTFTEDSEMVFARINPVEVVNCTEGKIKLYQSITYKIEYSPFSSIFIKSVQVPSDSIPDSDTSINITVSNLRTSEVSGTLSVSSNEIPVSSVLVTVAPMATSTIPLGFKAEKSSTDYAVSYSEGGEIKTSKRFKMAPKVFDVSLNSIPYQAVGLTVPVEILFDNKLSGDLNIEFDISIIGPDGSKYKPLHLPSSLSSGKNPKFVKIETSDLPAGAYTIIVSVSSDYGVSTYTQPLKLYAVDYSVSLNSVNSFSDGSIHKNVPVDVVLPKGVIIKSESAAFKGSPDGGSYPSNIRLFVQGFEASRIYGTLKDDTATLDAFTNGKSGETVNSGEGAKVTRYLKLQKTGSLKSASINIGNVIYPSGLETSGEEAKIVNRYEDVEASEEPRHDGFPSMPQFGFINDSNGTAVFIPLNISLDYENSSMRLQADTGSYCADWSADSAHTDSDIYGVNFVGLGPYCASHWKVADIDGDGYDEHYLLANKDVYTLWSRCQSYAASASNGYKKVVGWTDSGGTLYPDGCTKNFDRDLSKSPSYCDSEWENTYYDNPITSTSSSMSTKDMFCKTAKADGSSSGGWGWAASNLYWIFPDGHTENFITVNCGMNDDCSSTQYCRKPSMGNPTSYYCDSVSCGSLSCPEWKEQQNVIDNHACTSSCVLKPLRCENPGQELDETHYCDQNRYIQTGVKKIIKISGNQAWHGFGAKQETIDLKEKIIEYLSGCEADTEGYCEVPVEFTSNMANWDLKINSVAAGYTPLVDLGDAMQDQLSKCVSSPCKITVSAVSDTSGPITVHNPSVVYESYDYRPIVEVNDRIEVNEGETANLNIMALDIGNENISVNVTYPFDNSGVWNTGYDSAGEYDATIKVQDSGHLVQKSAHVKVKNVNRPPVADFLDDIRAMETEDAIIRINATDPDNDIVTYSANDTRFESLGSLSGNSHISENPALVWHTNKGDEGAYPVTVTVGDGEKFVSQDILVIIFKALNRLPIFGDFADIVANETDTVKINVTAIDPDGDNIVFFYSSPFDSNGVWRTDYDSSGIYDIEVTVSDGIYNVSDIFNLTILNVNRPPLLSEIANVTIAENETVLVMPIVSDPDNDELTLSFTAPLDASGRWQTGFDDAGVYEATVSVTDGELNDSQKITITVLNVNRGPQIITWPAGSVSKEGEPVTFEIVAIDPDGDELYYKWSVDENKVSSDRTFVYVPDYDSNGTRVIVAGVSDGDIVNEYMISQLVLNTNRPPVLDNINDIVVGQAGIITIEARATDPDNENPDSSDDNDLGFSINDTRFLQALDKFTLQSDLLITNQFYVTVSVSDGELSDSQEILIKINKPPVISSYSPLTDIAITEGGSLIFNIIKSDPENDPLAVKWLMNGSETSEAEDEYAYSSSVGSPGIYNITVTVSDGLTQIHHSWLVLVMERLPSSTAPFIFSDLTGIYSNNASGNEGGLWILYGTASEWNPQNNKLGTGYRAGYVMRDGVFIDDLDPSFSGPLAVGIDGSYGVAPQMLIAKTKEGTINIFIPNKKPGPRVAWRLYAAEDGSTYYYDTNHNGTGLMMDYGESISADNLARQRPDVICSSSNDCGSDYTTGRYCSANSVYQNDRQFSCVNPGRKTSYCTYIDDPTMVEMCGGGCSGGLCFDKAVEPFVFREARSVISDNASYNGGDLWVLFGVASVWKSDEGMLGTGYRAVNLSNKNVYSLDIRPWFDGSLSIGIDGSYSIAAQALNISTDKGAVMAYIPEKKTGGHVAWRLYVAKDGSTYYYDTNHDGTGRKMDYIEAMRPEHLARRANGQ